MNNITTLQIELGISAERIVQSLQIHNEGIEEQIKKGIELAFKDVSDTDSFVQLVREGTKQELLSIVNKAVMSYQVRNKISEMVEKKIGERIESYADEIADKITKSLK